MSDTKILIVDDEQTARDYRARGGPITAELRGIRLRVERESFKGLTGYVYGDGSIKQDQRITARSTRPHTGSDSRTKQSQR